MGLHHDDHFKRLKMLQDADAILADCGDLVEQHGLDVEVTRGRSIRGIVEGDSHPDVFIPALIDLFAQGRFPLDKLLSFYPFERINDAIHDSETGAAVKPVVQFPH
jgi:Zn-dependent alcohol dehydrogenase